MSEYLINKICYYKWKHIINEVNNEYKQTYIENYNEKGELYISIKETHIKRGQISYNTHINGFNKRESLTNMFDCACCRYIKTPKLIITPYFNYIKIPTNYWYSSGMNDLKGYKKW